MSTMDHNAPLDPELHELRCLQEIARQLLPLSSARDVARDGLLCVAGITGIGAGAVLWQRTLGAEFELLSHFGVERHLANSGYALHPEACEFLLRGPVVLESMPHAGEQRSMLAALEPIVEQLGGAWVLPLAADKRLRGVLLLGPSLVTDELLPDAGWISDLAEIVRLALVGCQRDADAVARKPARRAEQSAPIERRAAPEVPEVSQRLGAIRREYPATRALVGESRAVLGMLEEIVSLAETDYTVMIQGGTGTGKELAASLLHRLSRRAKGPFETVDCSSIPRELIESELFGHVKGAFTGASRDFKGAFERADGGSVLLDEIGDMDLRSQTRLLRVLQEGKVRRLGGDRPIPVDVRVIAATNRDLAAMVRAGTFREDLYYRIHVCPLPIPALRERGGDRVVLFEHFMHQHADELGRKPRELTDAARERLGDEEFPGNVRQLQNVVRQLLVQRYTEGPVEVDELDRVLATAALARAPLQPPGGTATRSEGADAMHASASPPGAAAHERAATAPSDTPHAGGVKETPVPVVDIGRWVLAQLRAQHFNLVAAARHLQGLRRNGASRRAVPVFDRGALDYYLCGEFFSTLVERAYDIDRVIGEIAGSPTMIPRVRRKVRAFVRPLAQLQQDGIDTTGVLRESYRRVPERYQLSMQEAIEAARAGRWDPADV